MYEQLKRGAINALILAFLAQPVWAATVSVDGAALWENTGAIDDTDNPPTGSASAVGVDILNSFTGGSVTNTGSGTIFANATSNAPDLSGAYAAHSKGIATTLAPTGYSVFNDGTVLVTASAPDDLFAGTFGMQLQGAVDVVNSGGMTVSSMADAGTAYATGIANSWGVNSLVNELGASIDVLAHSASGQATAVGLTSTSGIENMINRGTLTVSSTVEGGPSGAFAHGFSVQDLAGDMQNSGTIDVSVENLGSGSVDVYGIDYLGGNDLAGVDNSGRILVSGASSGSTGDFARGIHLRNISTSIGNVLVDNSGIIDVELDAGDVSSQAFGILFSGVTTTSGLVDNSGAISVSATGVDIHAYGVKGEWGTAPGYYYVVPTGEVVSTGDITVVATARGGHAFAGGIKGVAGDKSNNGTISVTATNILAGETAEAVGIDSASSAGNVTNTGNILVTARSNTGSNAEGANVFDGLTNTGTIKAMALTLSNPLTARAVGVSASNANGPISSSGTIVAGSTGEASGFDLTGSGSVTNTGSVRVAGDDGMYGIFLREGTWDVANSGTVQGYDAASILDDSTWIATNAFRTLRVGEDVSDRATATLTSAFQVILNGDPTGATFLAPIFVAEGSTLNLNSQDLIATPGANVTLNRGYRIIENEGTITGEFGGLVAGNPAISTTWTGADNGDNAEVTFGYEPEAPAAPEVASTMAYTATDQLRQFAMSNALRGTQIAPEGPTTIVRPWAGNLNRSHKDGVGFNAGMAGVLAGIEVPVTDDLVAGGHVVAGGAKVDYTGTGYSSNSEGQTIFGVGAHGRYTPGDWYLDGMLITYMVNHDYEGRTGLNLELGEDDEYESYGIEGSLIGGYKFHHDNITAMPFAGLGYSWLNTPGHETETATGTWQTKYGTLDEQNVRAVVGARVSAEYVALDGTITPSLGLRYEQSLTDNDIRIRQSLQGASDSVEGERADGSVILDAGLVYGRGPLAFELGGSIEKNDDFDAQSGFVGVRWMF